MLFIFILSNCGTVTEENFVDQKDLKIFRAPQNPELLLQFVNHWTTNQDVLKYDVGLTITQSRNIYNHKKGNDNIYGTLDDNLFDDINELDDVSYIGQSAIDDLDTYAITNFNSNDIEIPKYFYTLNYLNHRSLTYSTLDNTMGLDQDVAENLYFFRAGGDSLIGTLDNTYFVTVKDMDDIDQVGEVTLGEITSFCNNRNLPGVENTYEAVINWQTASEPDTGSIYIKSKLRLEPGITKNNVLRNSEILLNFYDTELIKQEFEWDTITENNWKLSGSSSIDTISLTWYSDTQAVLEMKIDFNNTFLSNNYEDTFLQFWRIQLRLGNNPFVVFDKIGDDELWKNIEYYTGSETISAWEYKKQGDFPAAFDFDNDGLADRLEDLNCDGYVGINESDPFSRDSEQDGIDDYSETMIFFTKPFHRDSDLDLLSDSEEVYVYYTNPRLQDTDGDSLTDGFETINNMNPLDTDIDNNGIIDGKDNFDTDMRSNYNENRYNTNPFYNDPFTIDNMYKPVIARESEANFRLAPGCNFITNNRPQYAIISSGNINVGKQVIIYFYGFGLAKEIAMIKAWDYGMIDDPFTMNVYYAGTVSKIKDENTEKFWIVNDFNQYSAVRLISTGVKTSCPPGTDYKVFGIPIKAALNIKIDPDPDPESDEIKVVRNKDSSENSEITCEVNEEIQDYVTSYTWSTAGDGSISLDASTQGDEIAEFDLVNENVSSSSNGDIIKCSLTLNGGVIFNLEKGMSVVKPASVEMQTNYSSDPDLYSSDEPIWNSLPGDRGQLQLRTRWKVLDNLGENCNCFVEETVYLVSTDFVLSDTSSRTGSKNTDPYFRDDHQIPMEEKFNIVPWERKIKFHQIYTGNGYEIRDHNIIFENPTPTAVIFDEN